MKLSEQQREILTWLSSKTAKIRAGGDEKAVEDLDNYGCRWNPESILGHPPSRSESASLSRSLGRLRDAGCVMSARLEGRVVNVMLTETGIHYLAARG